MSLWKTKEERKRFVVGSIISAKWTATVTGILETKTTTGSGNRPEPSGLTPYCPYCLLALDSQRSTSRLLRAN